MDPSPFATLGIAESSTPEQATRAFRKLAKKWHPDKNKSPEAAEMFRRFHTAFEQITKNRPALTHIDVLVTRQDISRGVKNMSIVLKRFNPFVGDVGLARVDLTVPLHDLGEYEDGDTIDVELAGEGNDVLTQNGWTRTSIMLNIRVQKVEVIHKTLSLFEALTCAGFYVTTKSGASLWVDASAVVCCNGAIIAMPGNRVEVRVVVQFPKKKLVSDQVEALRNAV
jgi:hypothetical protein